MRKCLTCYKEINESSDQEYHEKCSKLIFGTAKAPVLDYEYDKINALAKEVIGKRFAIPGVQAKLSLTLATPAPNTPNSRLTIVGLWNGLYILKPSNDKYPELPENEGVTMHLANCCGIKTAKHTLIRFKTGEIAYLCRRFDRSIRRRKLTKLHQEDMCQLTGLLTENKYNSSMEKVAKVTLEYTTNKGLEMVTLFQITVFSFLTGNSDMHLKNFSIIKQLDGNIELTPAYDLLATKLVVPQDKEEMALTMKGKKSNLTKNDFKAFGQYCHIQEKAVGNVFKGFEKKLPKMKQWIEASFLSNEMKVKYLKLIQERAERLSLIIPSKFAELENA